MITNSQFNEINLLALAASKFQHNGLTGLVVSNRVDDEKLLALTHYLFVKDIQKMYDCIVNTGFVDYSYCYPSFGYYSFEVKEGLTLLELHDLVLGHSQMVRKVFRGNARAKDMFLNTALHSPTEPYWYLAKYFKGEVTIRRIL